MNDDNVKHNVSDEIQNKDEITENNEVIFDSHKKISDLEVKLKETYDLFLRSKADLENLKKRNIKEIDHSVKYANKKFIISLLPLLDSLEACLNVKEANSVEDIVIFHKMLLSILHGFGLNKISVELYSEFDPLKHEAISFVSSDKYDNLISEVVQNGYMLHDQVIRYSKVNIFRKDNI